MKKFILCLLICLGGGWLSGLATQNSVDHWYPQLIKSAITPPAIVFPIVWTLLYFLMAISLWLMWISPTKHKAKAAIAFGLQLFFNFIWSTLFFYKKNPLLGLIDITLLWPLILCTIVLFWNHTKTGALLLIPYLLWTSLAFYLNFFIWTHN